MHRRVTQTEGSMLAVVLGCISPPRQSSIVEASSLSPLSSSLLWPIRMMKGSAYTPSLPRLEGPNLDLTHENTRGEDVIVLFVMDRLSDLGYLCSCPSGSKYYVQQFGCWT